MANGKFNLGISISVDTKKAENEILKEAAKVINRNIERKLFNLNNRVGSQFKERVANTEEYASLISDNGQLRLEFGIQNQTYIMPRILGKLEECFTVHYEKARVTNGRIEGSLSVRFNKADFSFLYEEASFRNLFGFVKRKPKTSFTTDKKDKIDWLRWLLESGTNTVIPEYRVKFGNFGENSRTGGAIMVTGNGVNWGVPAEYAGTSKDNWLTRTLAQFEKDVQEILDLEIQEGLKNVS